MTNDMKMSWDRNCCISTAPSSIDSGVSSTFSPSSLPRDYDVTLTSSSSSSSSSSVFFFPSSDYVEDQSNREQEENNTLTIPLLHHYHLHSTNFSTRTTLIESCSCHHSNYLYALSTVNESSPTFIYEQYLTSFKQEQSEYLPYPFDNVVYPQPCSPPSPTNDAITYYQLDQVHSNPSLNKISTRSSHSTRAIQPIIYQQLSSIEPSSSNSQQQLPIVKRFYYDSTMSTTTMTSTTPVPTIHNGNESISFPYARLESPAFGTFDIWRERTVVGRKNTRRPIDVNMGDTTSVVSRIHFEILLINRNEFHLKCLSKNGIFINNHYTSMSSTYLLPKQCTLRFPSTDLCITFSSLIPSTTHHHRLSVDSNPIPELSLSILNENNPSPSPISSSHQQVIVISNNGTSTSETNIINGFPPLSIQISNCSSSSNESPTSTGSCSEPMKFNDEHSTSFHQGAFGLISPKEELIETTTSIRVNSCANPELNGLELDVNSSKTINKPPFSYAQLIVQAIASAPDKQMTLSQIYNFISAQYPYYEYNNRGWQNSIRHNLSLNRYFIRSARRENDAGKGSFWRLDQKCEEKLIDHAFRHRKQRTIHSTMSNVTTLKNEFDDGPTSPTENFQNEPGDFLLADLHMSSPSASLSPINSVSPPRSNERLKRKRLDEDDEDQQIRRPIENLLNFLTESIAENIDKKLDRIEKM